MTQARCIIVCAIWTAGILGSCKKDRIDGAEDEAAKPESAKVVDPTASPETTKAHMQDHFGRSADLLAAVVAGDVAGAKAQADWLAEHETHPSLRGWEPSVAELRAAARPGPLMDLAAMARVAANVGAACGSCHQKTKSIPSFASVPSPGSGSRAEERMLLHKWAADRMWEGLIAPSDDLWSRGVEAMAIAPLHDDEILKNASAAPEIVAQAEAVHELANDASNATTPQARADAFARFLENCATCHARVGMGD